MGEVKPRILPNGAVYYPNPIARTFLAFFPVIMLLGTLIGLPLFLHVYKPIALLYIGLPIVMIFGILFLYQTSTYLIMGIEIGQNHVILRYLFKKKRIHPSEVREVEVKPPVYSDSLEFRWWGVEDSKCKIRLIDGSELLVAQVPNGVKLRLARVLDPQNFPVAE